MTSSDIRPDGWSQQLLDTAAHWPTEPSIFKWRGPAALPGGGYEIRDFVQQGIRCADPQCRTRIEADTPAHKAQHLVMCHGYRMDGRREEPTSA